MGAARRSAPPPGLMEICQDPITLLSSAYNVWMTVPHKGNKNPRSHSVVKANVGAAFVVTHTHTIIWRFTHQPSNVHDTPTKLAFLKGWRRPEQTLQPNNVAHAPMPGFIPRYQQRGFLSISGCSQRGYLRDLLIDCISIDWIHTSLHLRVKCKEWCWCIAAFYQTLDQNCHHFEALTEWMSVQTQKHWGQNCRQVHSR